MFHLLLLYVFLAGDDADEINQAAQALASMAANVTTAPPSNSQHSNSVVTSPGRQWTPPASQHGNITPPVSMHGSVTPPASMDSGSDTTSPRPQIISQYGPGDLKKG